MPDLSRGISTFGSTNLVAPLSNNLSTAGACSDGKGQALYGTHYGGEGGPVQVFRTSAGYKSLAKVSNSVTYLSTIDSRSWTYPTTVGLQRIGGTVYAVVTGKNMSTLMAGSWIYRDTSASADGSGPWVLHGTIDETAIFAAMTGHFSGGRSGGEILVDGSRWAVNAYHFGYLATSDTSTVGNFIVSTSEDGGSTWTTRIVAKWYTNGGTYGLRWARNFAKFGGAWYVGGSGDPGDAQHYKSTDLINWTGIGGLGYGGGQGMAFLVSAPGVIYRALFDQPNLTLTVDHAVAAPEALPAWTNDIPNLYGTFVGSTGPGQAYPHLCNVSTDANPYWVLLNNGYVLDFAGARNMAPPCRQYPREDGLATSSATRLFPQPRSEQGGLRQAGGTYY